MKKITILLAVVATLVGNAAQAQTTGRAAAASKQTINNNDDFSWGIGLVSIAVLGTVVGLTAASAASSPNSFSTAH